MTDEEKQAATENAEQIVMAAAVGMFNGTRSALAHAHLLLAQQDAPEASPLPGPTFRGEETTA